MSRVQTHNSQVSSLLYTDNMNESKVENRKCADILFRVSDGYLVADFKTDELDLPLTKSVIIERLNHAGFESHVLTDENFADLITGST